MKPHEVADRDSQPSEIKDAMLRAFIGYRLKRAYMAIEPEVNAVLAEHDLKVTTFSALAVVIENPDLTQSMLADALELKRSSVVVIADQLENADLITRNPVQGDRRSYALRATLRGRRLFDRISSAIAACESRFEKRLDAEERNALRRYLEVIEGKGGTSAITT